MEADSSMRARILAMVPQQPPFRFIDEIQELDEEWIVGAYRFRGDEFFYQGHFPGLGITPGGILLETMAQTVAALGLYLALLRANGATTIHEPISLFTLVENAEFFSVVRPNESVRITGRKIYFRGGQIKVDCRMGRPDGEEVCAGTLAGKGIPREKLTE